MVVRCLNMVTTPFHVKWYGPYSFVESADENVFTCLIGKKTGVYLFTIPFEGKYLVYYVGETGVSFANRSLQHVQSYLNGFYRVFDPEEFEKGRKVLLWGGMWKTDRREPKLLSCNRQRRKRSRRPNRSEYPIRLHDTTKHNDV